MAYNRRLTGLGHAFQAAGAYNLGHIVRAASAFGVGGEATNFSELATSVGATAAALGGVIVAAKLVEAGFKGITETASALVGAISQIGGAKGLQSMLVESANVERMAVDIANNAADKVSKSQVFATLQALSNKSEYTSIEVGEMARAFEAKRGNFAEFAQLGGFTTNLASVSGLTPGQAGALMGQLRVQFPQFSMEETQQAALNLWGAGRTGAVELKDATHITRVLGLSSKLVPEDTMKGIGLEMGMVQLAQRFMGGDTASQAVTSILRLQESLLNPTQHNAYKSELGGEYLQKNAFGEMGFINAPHTMAQLAVRHMEGLSAVKDIRGQRGLTGIIGGELESKFSAGMSEQQKVGIVEDYLKRMEEGKLTLEEYNKATQEVKDTVQWQFRNAINNLTNELEGKFYLVLKEVTPAIKGFADYLILHKDQVGQFLERFVAGLIFAATELPSLGRAAHGLMSAFLDIMKGIGTVYNVTFGNLPGFRKAVTSQDEAQTQYDAAKTTFDRLTAPGSRASSSGATKEDISDVMVAQRTLQEAAARLAIWKSVGEAIGLSAAEAFANAKASASDMFDPGAGHPGSKYAGPPNDSTDHTQTNQAPTPHTETLSHQQKMERLQQEQNLWLQKMAGNMSTLHPR